MHNKLIILAAGASTRMKESMSKGTSSYEIDQLSKALIRIGKKQSPLLLYLLDNAKKAGYEEIYLVVNERYDAFKSLFGNQISNNEYYGLNIHYAIQSIPKGNSKPLGTADAVLQALEQYPHLRESTFTICNSDNLYSIEAFKALQNDDHKNAMIRYDRSSLLFNQEKISKFAVLKVDYNGFLINITEKPASLDAEKAYWISMNLFKLHGPMVYTFLRDCPLNPIRKEKELPTALLNMCGENEQAIFAIPMSEHVPDLTRKEDINSFNDYLKDL
jgi:glucose-1-phosphate adenylyltransferase